MFCIIWFSPEKDMWNVKKLEVYNICATIFVLLLAINGAQKVTLCLGELFKP
jgi:hypothetical protein